MAETHPPGFKPGPISPVLPPRPPVKHPVTKRHEVVSHRTPGSAPTSHPAVYEPWTRLLAAGDARLRTEITDAIRALEADTSTAGQILDRAHTMSAEATGTLEAAAWEAWHKYIAAADALRASIMGPALEAYEQAITDAHKRFEAAVNEARKVYDTIAADAALAKRDAAVSAA